MVLRRSINGLKVVVERSFGLELKWSTTPFEGIFRRDFERGGGSRWKLTSGQLRVQDVLEPEIGGVD